MFSKTNEIAQALGLVQFVVFEKINKCLFIPNCTRKSWDYVLISFVRLWEDVIFRVV